MRKFFLTAALFGSLMSVLATTSATALPLGPEQVGANVADSTMVVPAGAVRWRGPYGGGVAWRGPYGGGYVRRPAWGVGWVGPGFYYNPGYYNRYYHPRYGYCRLTWYQGVRVCKWNKRRWW